MKNKHVAILSLVLAMLFGLMRQVRAETITLAPIKDNTLYENANGSLSNGAGEYLFVGRTRAGLIRRGIIAFDIAGNIPAGSTINSVSLTLNMSKTTNGSQIVGLHNLLSDWGEGTSNAPAQEGGGTQSTLDGSTWIHTFYDSVFWTAQGGDFSSTASATVSVGGVGTYTWGSETQMIEDVQAWLDTPSSNFGWLILGNESSPNTTKRFDTKENGNPANRPTLIVDYTPGEIRIRLDSVATGLTAPNWGTFAPGDPEPLRLFVTDQNGILWAIHLETGEKTVFLDVRDLLVSLGTGGPGTFDERGLLGVAFHPDYAVNGLLYTYTSEPVNGEADFSTLPEGTTADHQSVITEWSVPNPGDPASVVDSTSRFELLRIDQPQFNHDGGAINFGPDGMLYISLGDGGNADDQGTGHGTEGNGQNPGTILGTILRIDATGSNSSNGKYGIPADNPFVGRQNFLDEIFAYGLRNPFRFSFDSVTGEMYVGDVGQNDIEEIDIVTSGGNYGWNLKEGTFFFDPNGDENGFVTDVDPGGIPLGLIDPIAQYDHNEGIAVIGGFVYRGTKIPKLEGKYVFGDLSRQFFGNNGRLFYLDDGEIHEFEITNFESLGLSLLGFGQDAVGEIYVLGNMTGTPFGDTGVVLKIAPGCFIATAAYGSFMEPQVKILRELRDKILMETQAGRAFTNLYYIYSPPVADFIANHELIQAIVRWSLLPIVGLSWVALNIGLAPTFFLIFTFMACPILILLRKRRLKRRES